MNKQELFSELSIKIAILEAKIDKLLQLAMKPEVTTQPLEIMSLEDVLTHNKNAVNLFKDLIPAGSVVDCSGVNAIGKLCEVPLQWPNEPLTDYLKRIGQYNEAQSTDEQFTENFK